ncbi:DUF2079 domain-containing protein [Candidatus Gottesmanbacteria bacterium]|nr:DUF2079 domain-containing protein [Candidatus Gottesmanbacteria bacterium]
MKHVLIIWILLLSIVYSALSIVRHNHFQSGGFDLGIYDQAVWQYAHFQWPYNTIKDRFILGDHLTLTLPLLAPLFWLWSDARILLIFQAFWISFSSLAMYKIAIVRLRNAKLDPRVKPEDDRKNEVVAMCLAVVYSLFYGIQYLVFFDFHPVIIGVGLLAWTAYFLESGKTRWLVSSVALLLLTQENMGLALAGLGFIYVFRLPRHPGPRAGIQSFLSLIPGQARNDKLQRSDDRIRRAGAWFIIVGIAASLAAARIVAAFSPVGFEYQPEIPLNPVVILSRFFDHSEKLQVWWWSFASFSFLPLLSPGAVLAVASDLFQYFATGERFVQMWTPYKHHRAILGVFLVLGTLDAIMFLMDKIKPSFQRAKLGFECWIALMLVMVTFSLQYVWHLPLNKLVKAEYWKEEQWMIDNRTLFTLIPSGVAVATQQNFVPHLSRRNQIYLAWPRVHDFKDKPCGQTSCWWLDFDSKAEYLLVDTRPDQWLTQILESNDHWLEAIRNMEKSGRITIAESVGSAKLYRIVLQ